MLIFCSAESSAHSEPGGDLENLVARIAAQNRVSVFAFSFVLPPPPLSAEGGLGHVAAHNVAKHCLLCTSSFLRFAFSAIPPPNGWRFGGNMIFLLFVNALSPRPFPPLLVIGRWISTFGVSPVPYGFDFLPFPFVFSLSAGS